MGSNSNQKIPPPLDCNVKTITGAMKVFFEEVQGKQPFEFQGLLEFDLGNVYHSSFGNIHVKSNFPRLLPKHERKHVELIHLEALNAKLLVWVRQHFDTNGREQYFQELIMASTLFTVYVNPLPELYSNEMSLAIKIYFWLWYCDDEIENSIENSIPFELLKQGTDQLCNILKGIYDTGTEHFKDVPNYAFFKPLFHSLMNLHEICHKSVPDYMERVGPMHYYLQRYFEAQRWFAVDPIDSRYSEESFRNWRRIIAYFDGIAEVIALIHGVTLPKYIARSPTLKRLLDISNSFGGFVNDLVGMKKEFKNDQKDNLIVFKVLQKNIPLKKAVEQVCGLMRSELSDFLLLKQVILKEFSGEPNLVKYLDILESLIDGHNKIYPESTRHRSAGLVTLTRF